MSARDLADQLTLGGLLARVRELADRYELIDHWQQGEFHHDTVLRVDPARLGVDGPIVIIATNCNGGVKEVLVFAELPDRAALWHSRCPHSPEFAGELPPLLDSARTQHWFDPCTLLADDARSELRAEFRERQAGGGWRMKAAEPSESGASAADGGDEQR